MLILFIMLSILNFFIDKKIYLIKEFIHNSIIYRDILFNENKFNNQDMSKYQTEETTVKQIEFNDKNYNKYCGEKRIEFGRNYTKKPVIILGCSYAYGHGLKREQTFPYLLSELTKRPIYNFAECGGDILKSYNGLYSNNNFPNISDAEYMIYIYMHDHINRYLLIDQLYNNYELAFPIPNNKIQNNLLKIPLFRFIFTLAQLKKINLFGNDINLYVENSKNLMKNIIINTYKKLKQKAPNAKMIIILYDEKLPDKAGTVRIILDSEIQNSNLWDELEKETDIKVVRTKDLTGFLFDKNYKLKEDIADWHPNEKAWKVLTPLFVNKYMI